MKNELTLNVGRNSMRDKHKISMVIFSSVLMLMLFTFPGHEARALFFGLLIYPVIPAALWFSKNQQFTKYHHLVYFAITLILLPIYIFDSTKDYNSYLLNYYYPYVPEGTTPTTSFFYIEYLTPRIITVLLFIAAVIALIIIFQSLFKKLIAQKNEI
jgi:hypothetical protein